MFRDLYFRLRVLFRRKKVEAELDEELRGHVERQTAKHAWSGMFVEQARRKAKVELGGVEQVKEECRDARGIGFIETTFRDVGYGLRQLRRNPGFAIVAILTLALGIGANTAIFSVVNAVLLEPLPFHDPGRLVQLWETEASPGNFPLPGPDYLDWEKQNRTLAASSLYLPALQENLSIGSGAVPATVVKTQANFFSLLGVQPLLGRTFARGEDRAGRNQVAVLSYGIWQEQFGGRRGILGKSVELNGKPYTVIGIMPRAFSFPSLRRAGLWTPIDMSPQNLGNRGNHQYRVIARLKDGVTPAAARADLTAIEARLGKLFPDDDANVNAVVVPLQEQLTNGSRTQLLILLGAVALVLLIACANLASLLLARATARHHEMALRAALGAGRWRLTRQLLTESVTLALVGGGIGLGAAWWFVDHLRNIATLPIPLARPVAIDLRVLLFTAGVSVFVGILFGLAPALQASGIHLSQELKWAAQSVAGPSGGRQLARQALVVAEIALSLMLLIGAGLLLRTFAQMRGANVGVQSNGLLTMGISLPPAQYGAAAARHSFLDQLMAKVRNTPGVRHAALSSEIPLEGGMNGYVSVPGNTNPAIAKQLVEWNFVTPDYFRTYGVPFLQGRDFTSVDLQRAAEAGPKLVAVLKTAHGKAPAIPPDLVIPAVISRSMARTFWPGQNPIGKVFTNGLSEEEVIGVVGDVNEFSIRGKPYPETYYPYTLGLAFAGQESIHLTVRTGLAPASLLAPVRNDLASLDRSVAVYRPRTMRQVIADRMQSTSLQTFLLGLFAAFALFLGGIGIYGVMTYLVTRRAREMGIRVALGATPGQIERMVLREGGKLALLGAGIGIAGALALTRVLAGLLYGVRPADPLTFGVASSILMAVGLLACYVPARRAMRVDPAVALRHE